MYRTCENNQKMDKVKKTILTFNMKIFFES